jgi:hypothetical protein
MLENFLKGNHFKVAPATMLWLWRIMELGCSRGMEASSYLYNRDVDNLSHEGFHLKLYGLRGDVWVSQSEQGFKYWPGGQGCYGLRH